MREAFEHNEETKAFFKRWKESKDGFEQFLSPKSFYDNPELAYVDQGYKVKLDLFNGLGFDKPVAETLDEIKQYIDNSTAKIIARGEAILRKLSVSEEI